MTDKKSYWIHDGGDTYALVTGAEQRDRYVGAGWVETEEPTAGFVTVWRDGIAQPGRTSVVALREVYQPAGWLAGPPADGVNPFEAVQAETSAPAESKPKPSTKVRRQRRREGVTDGRHHR
jgi:hypothetical protein